MRSRAILLACLLAVCVACAAKKNIVDLTDGDAERIFRQWEENDEDAEDYDDEPKPSGIPLDLEGLKEGKVDPQDLVKESKRGKPVMLFVGVKGDPTEHESTTLSNRWMQSLQNAHLQVQRYLVAPNRVLFMVNDGSKAWEVKDYLITQTECTTVSFEQLSFTCAESHDEL